MNLRDLFNPQRALGFSCKLFLVVLALLLAPHILANLLSAFPSAGVCLALPLVSYVAYRVREQSRRRPQRARPTAGAERTPVLPQGEEH